MLVRVYRNIPRNCLTVAHMGSDDNWKVAHYSNSVLLADVEMVVVEARRFDYLRSGRVNLHAWLEGQLMAADTFALNDDEAPRSDIVENRFPWVPEAEAVADMARDCTAVGYNPDRARFFYEKETMDAIESAPFTLAEAPAKCFAFAARDLPADVALDQLLKDAA